MTKVAEAIKTLKGFSVGKPLVIEETYPLFCSPAELKSFMLESKSHAGGWMGHYAGDTPVQLAALKASSKITIPQLFMLNWLDLFRDMKAEMGVQ